MSRPWIELEGWNGIQAATGPRRTVVRLAMPDTLVTVTTLRVMTEQGPLVVMPFELTDVADWPDMNARLMASRATVAGLEARIAVLEAAIREAVTDVNQYAEYNGCPCLPTARTLADKMLEGESGE